MFTAAGSLFLFVLPKPKRALAVLSIPRWTRKNSQNFSHPAWHVFTVSRMTGLSPGYCRGVPVTLHDGHTWEG
jgi:hypothetical protein